MSHEIRTPLNAILGISEIRLRKRNCSPESEEDFQQIYSSSKLLLNIINDILDLAMINSGKIKIINARYDVPSLIADSVQLNLSYRKDKKIECHLAVDENLPASLIGDELRLRQIINNVVSNAFKYTEEGHVYLTFGIEKVKETLHLIISVRDTGQGMTKEQIEEMDEEFARFNENENRGIEGAGLGWPITKQMVNLMNGSINIESEPGVGSNFTIRIPQKSGSENVIGKEAASSLEKFDNSYLLDSGSSQQVFDPMPDARILAVDDVEANLYVLQEILFLYEITVEIAHSAKEAIARIKDGETFDIIFMDHMMPEMDGIEATRIIQEMGYEKPIVALSANAVKGMRETFMENGFSDFISKPIELEEMEACLKKFIKSKHVTRFFY
jgi:CheY-like chemotaxis protein